LTSTLSERGRTTIPAAVRKALKLRPDNGSSTKFERKAYRSGQKRENQSTWLVTSRVRLRQEQRRRSAIMHVLLGCADICEQLPTRYPWDATVSSRHHAELSTAPNVPDFEPRRFRDGALIRRYLKRDVTSKMRPPPRASPRLGNVGKPPPENCPFPPQSCFHRDTARSGRIRNCGGGRYEANCQQWPRG
jgi:hypothetical protein